MILQLICYCYRMESICPHIDYFIATYSDKIASDALHVNTYFKGKKYQDVAFESIAKFCYDLGMSTVFELPETLNDTCDCYAYHAKYYTPKCLVVEYLTQQHYIEFLQLVATYTIVFNASIVGDAGVAIRTRKNRLGSRLCEVWMPEDYHTALYHTMGGPAPYSDECVLSLIGVPSAPAPKPFDEIPNLPEEYEAVMIKAFGPVFKDVNYDIRLNTPYVVPDVSSAMSSYGAFSVGFTY